MRGKNNVPLFHGPHRPPGSIRGPSSRALQHHRGEGPAETRVATATLTYAEGKHTDYILALVTASTTRGCWCRPFMLGVIRNKTWNWNLPRETRQVHRKSTQHHMTEQTPVCRGLPFRVLPYLKDKKGSFSLHIVNGSKEAQAKLGRTR